MSESGTWQHSVALFLQRHLKVLPLDDPFIVTYSNMVLEFLDSVSDKCCQAFSIDVKDLFYSLPHNLILARVAKSIDKYGSVALQNTVGISVCGFLELLDFYLRSTYVEFEGSPHLQKQGVCIGSCIAPILSDIVLAHHERLTV